MGTIKMLGTIKPEPVILANYSDWHVFVGKVEDSLPTLLPTPHYICRLKKLNYSHSCIQK